MSKIQLDPNEVAKYANELSEFMPPHEAAIKALCDAINIKLRPVAPPPTTDCPAAEFRLEQISIHLQLFHAKRLSWKEVIETIENEIKEYYGHEDD